jgi:hypothetical protein
MTEGVKKRWAKFCVERPQVEAMLVAKAREAKAKGHPKISIWLLANVLRWEFYFTKAPGEQFKIPNDYLALYVRYIQSQPQYADIAGMFDTRPLKHDVSQT